MSLNSCFHLYRAMDQSKKRPNLGPSVDDVNGKNDQYDYLPFKHLEF